MERTTAQELLVQARKICVQHSVYLTPQCLEALHLIGLQDGATSAYDLPDLLRRAEPQVKPLTVYRALDFLPERGFVHKVEPTNSYVFYHLFDQPIHASAMFICDRCGAMKEECAEDVEDIMHTLAVKIGLALRHNMIEVHELCAACVEVEARRCPEQCQYDHSVQVEKKPR